MTFGIDPSTWHAAVQVFSERRIRRAFHRFSPGWRPHMIFHRLPKEKERERGCWSVVMNSVGNMDEGKNGEQRETNERKVR